MEKLTDGIKTLLLASLGAASLTADKSRELHKKPYLKLKKSTMMSLYSLRTKVLPISLLRPRRPSRLFSKDPSAII